MHSSIFLTLSLLFTQVLVCQDHVIDGQIMDSYISVIKLIEDKSREISHQEFDAINNCKLDVNCSHNRMAQIINEYKTLTIDNRKIFNDSTDYEFEYVELNDLFNNIDELAKLHFLKTKFQVLEVIDSNGVLVDEAESLSKLRFFNIKEGDEIGEIGFGYGYTLYLMGLQYGLDFKVYANEIDKWKLNKFKEKINNYYPADIAAKYVFVRGKSTSTSMEGLSLDIIILQNTLHHLNQKSEMLKSIRKSLNDDGRLIIIEEYRRNEVQDRCHLLMTQNDLNSLMTSCGFNRIKQFELVKSNSVIIEYQ